ncbi:MAG: lactonase family protein [Cellvibrionaceae bacterium]|nr:lactonase family protein [Cellvibrionaceae bacterium]
MKTTTRTQQYIFGLCILLCLSLCLVYLNRSADTPPERLPGGSSVSLLLGSFTVHPAKNEQDGQGAYLVEFSPHLRQFSEPRLLTSAPNPSYFALSEAGRVYSVFRGADEESDTLNVFSWHAQQRALSPISSVPAAGRSPCYVALHPDETHVVVANYQSGNVSVYALNPSSGAVKVDSRQLIAHSGRGPHQSRQASAHAHWAQWNAAGNKLYVVDLGIDKVMMYPFDRQTGEVGAAEVAYTAQPGAGPRHMAFHPTLARAYLLNELNSTLTALKVEKNGRLKKVATLSTLPQQYRGPNQAAHIEINRASTAIYTSNRGHNSIAVFQLDPSGAMRLKHTVGSGGLWPRHFLLLEQYQAMVVANVRSNNLALLNIEDDGGLTNTEVSTFAPKPNFVTALRAN